MSVLGFGKKEKANLPALLEHDIPVPKSIFAACIKASAQAMNEALGCNDPAMLTEYLQTELGKKWQEGLRGYAAHVVLKLPDVVI